MEFRTQRFKSCSMREMLLKIRPTKFNVVYNLSIIIGILIIFISVIYAEVARFTELIKVDHLSNYSMMIGIFFIFFGYMSLIRRANKLMDEE